MFKSTCFKQVDFNYWDHTLTARIYLSAPQAELMSCSENILLTKVIYCV